MPMDYSVSEGYRRFGNIEFSMNTFPSLVEEQEPISFPKKSFDAITTFTAKQEQGVRFKRIQMVVTFDDLSKPGDTLSKVGVSANYDDP